MDPFAWRLARAAACSAVVGFASLSLIAIAESAANHGSSLGGGAWHLDKAESVSWWIAAAAFPWFALTPLPKAPLWGFLRAASPLAVLWIVYDQAAKVSEPLHHAEPAWIEWVTYAVLYVGLVPWASWRSLVKARSPPSDASTA